MDAMDALLAEMERDNVAGHDASGEDGAAGADAAHWALSDASGDACRAALQAAGSRASGGPDGTSPVAADVSGDPEHGRDAAGGGGLWAPHVAQPIVHGLSCRCSTDTAAAPAPPALAAEAARYATVASLVKWWERALKHAGLDVHISTLERWLLGRRHEAERNGYGGADPILPSEAPPPPSGAPAASAEADVAPEALLAAELRGAGASASVTTRLVRDLNERATRVARGLRKHNAGAAGSAAVYTVKARQVKGGGAGTGGVVELEGAGVSMHINAAHLNKLRAMHRGDPADFHAAALTLLLRYGALAGGQGPTRPQGGGMQGAVHGALFDVLLRRFDCRYEAFASPFNCRYRAFGSAFRDTDGTFGGVGSFFSPAFEPLSGCFEANPPFVPNLMLDMARKMEALLARAERLGSALGFVVVVPSCAAAAAALDRGGSAARRVRPVQRAATHSWLQLRESAHCVARWEVPAKAHGYVEGTAHARPTRYKTSAFATSVVVLATRAAAAAWGVDDEATRSAAQREVVAAFASRHEAELAARRAAGVAPAAERRRARDAGEGEGASGGAGAPSTSGEAATPPPQRREHEHEHKNDKDKSEKRKKHKHKKRRRKGEGGASHGGGDGKRSRRER